VADADSNPGHKWRACYTVKSKMGRNADRGNQCNNMADPSGAGLSTPEREELRGARWREERRAASKCGWWASEPDVGRVAHGVAARVDRLRALGNGQVPSVAALAWQTLTRAR
jgi:DNA (cytosine-5)-methyltransferase 1